MPDITSDAQRLLDIAAASDASEGIRQGMEDVRERRTRPARQFFAEFEVRQGISRQPQGREGQ